MSVMAMFQQLASRPIQPDVTGHYLGSAAIFVYQLSGHLFGDPEFVGFGRRPPK